MIANKTLIFTKLSIITATIATVGLTLADLAPANAALLTIAVNGIIESGDLIDTTYTGTFSFQEPLLPDFSDTVPVDALSITFTDPNTNPPATATFTEADADPLSPPLVEYDNGNLLGLEFSVDDAQLGTVHFTFSFVPGFPGGSITDAYLTYDVLDDGTGSPGQGGAGNAVFEVVPEPTSMLASFGILGLIGYHKRRRNK